VSDRVHGEASSDGAPRPDGATDPADAADGADVAGEPESSPLGRALDLLVFAPVGVALTVAEDLPTFIDKGRQRFETDIRNARVIGEFVVRLGHRQLIERVGKLIHNEPSPPSTEAPTGSAPIEGVSASAPPATPLKPEPDPADGVIVDEALAGYDTLSASQVVRRLESLQIDQLRAVHRHEASHRNRRTILNRAHQLLDAANASASANGSGTGNGSHTGDPSGESSGAAPTGPDHVAE
jgi:hypothetical protein